MSRVIALDPGAVRLGVAISNRARTMAFPRPYIARDDRWIDSLAALVVDEDAGVVVIGLPIALSGDATSARALAADVERQIREVLPDVVVDVVDERFTTTIATSALRDAGLSAREQRSRVDSAAAVVLLQGYLDAHVD